MKKLEVSVQTARWFDEKKPVESMKFIKECGFEGVDYNINSLFQFSFDEENLTSFFDRSLEEIYEYYVPLKEAAKENGISFSQAHALFPPYHQGGGRDALNDYLIMVMEKMIAACGYLECPSIVIHPWIDWDNHDLEKEEEINMRIYTHMIPFAKQYGVKICLENMGVDSWCTDITDVCRHIDELNEIAGEDIFGFCLDIGHAKLTGKILYRYIKALGKRLTVLHIHDNDGSKDSHVMPFTQVSAGNQNELAIDWDGMLKGLKEIGYEGPLAFETFVGITVVPPEMKKDALKYICAAGNYMRDKIEE